MTANLEHAPPAGCPSNLDDLVNQRAGNASLAIPARAAVGQHPGRLGRRRRMIPESSRSDPQSRGGRASRFLHDLALSESVSPALLR